MAQALLLLVIGFVLTTVVGGALGYMFQHRTWVHQHEVQRRDEERQQALNTFQDVSLLLDRRLYRMRRLYWAARALAAGTAGEGDLSTALASYREVLAEWNDNLNRTLALIETYFGSPIRSAMEQIYEEFVTLGRGLEEIVRIARGPENSEVPRFGYRVTRLSRHVYALNVRMLGLLKEDSVGRHAPEKSAVTALDPGAGTQLEIGDQGRAVRRLQRALRRAGEDIDIDGFFRQKTWMAVRSLQRSQGLSIDGIVGPDTWAKLPPGSAMPFLRLASKGQAVTGLQRALTQQAPGRWEVTPEAITGSFDASTSIAVQAFQRWTGITEDGLVGEQTWAAPISEAGPALEIAVGLEHAVGETSL